MAVGAILAPELFDFALDEGLSTADVGMELNIPPEFSVVKIPERNENYRSPENILLDAFDLYESWRGRGATRLPMVHYEKGEEYLDAVSIARKFPRFFATPDGETAPGSLSARLYMMMMADTDKQEVDAADIPEISGFSALSQNGIVDFIFHNPGSKIITQAQEFVCKKYGWNRKQLISSILSFDKNLPEVDGRDWDQATKIASNRLRDAVTWFEKRRVENGKPLSVSEVIAYFLYQNDGDLKTSLWDSTLLLKVLVRNDIDTLRVNDSLDGAEKIAYLFEDEFSPRISHNWLMRQFSTQTIPKDSPLYASGAMDFDQWKNFMPINKDGTYYHVMNIITWAAVSMDPWVVKSMLVAYYNEQDIGGMDHRSEHGVDKVNADLLAAKAAGRIKRVADWGF